MRSVSSNLDTSKIRSLVTLPEYPDVEEPIVEPEVPGTEIDPVIPEEPVIPEQPHISGKIWWYHSDHLGSSSYLTDINGIPTHYYGYLPFGELMVEHNNSNYNNVYKFNGKELDEKTGFYYYGARYYDPVTSIFLSVDPLAEDFPGWNPYHYVHNNPINLIDPTGMSADGWRENHSTGEVKYDESYTSDYTPEGYTYFDGGVIDKTVYNTNGTTESLGGGTAGCVDCHHTANIGNLDLSGSSPYLQGSLNIAGGLLGATAASAYMLGTEGVGVAFGGATALTLSIGQISIGASQIGNAWVGGSNQALENSNSILGYGAKVMNSPYSDIIDSGSGLLGGSLSGGVIRGVFNNSRNIMNGKSSLKSAYGIYDTSKSAYDTQKAIKEYREIYNGGKRK